MLYHAESPTLVW